MHRFLTNNSLTGEVPSWIISDKDNNMLVFSVSGCSFLATISFMFMWSFFLAGSCETTNISISHLVKTCIINSISNSVVVIYLTTILQGHVLILAISSQRKLSSIHYIYVHFILFSPCLLPTFFYDSTGTWFPVIHL